MIPCSVGAKTQESDNKLTAFLNLMEHKGHYDCTKDTTYYFFVILDCQIVL